MLKQTYLKLLCALTIATLGVSVAGCGPYEAGKTVDGGSEMMEEGKETSTASESNSEEAKASEANRENMGPASSDIVETAVSAGDFETLVTAVKAANLVETLKSEGPFTVFAPSDKAFAKLPKETLNSLLKPENRSELTRILTYHVVPGNVMASDAKKLNSAETVQGGNLELSTEGESLTVDGAQVVQADIKCSNGVIHVIDAVLLPKSQEKQAGVEEAALKNIVETAMAADNFQTLVAAVKAADLVEVLQSEGPFTVFSPTDEAFATLPEGALDSLLKPENKEKLKSILTYHVVPGKVMSSEVVNLSEAKTVQGQSVNISTESEGVKINDANVTKTDIVCSNGVIHVIDSVIMP